MFLCHYNMCASTLPVYVQDTGKLSEYVSIGAWYNNIS